MNTKRRLYATVTCRETSEEGNARWFQTFPPFGRYPVDGTLPDAKKGAVLVLDKEGADALLAAFNEDAGKPDWPGILVDREHFSTMADKPSDAMAWARGIRLASDGSIWTRWDFTPEGERLWRERVLVNRSPCFVCEANKDETEFRPLRLVSIGMTNTPHFTELSTRAAARSTEKTNPQKEETKMDKIAEALGLEPGATEEQILAAIAALNERATTAEASATDAEKKLEEEEAQCRSLKCDAFVAKHSAKIADAAAFRAAYMKDPETAEKAVAACRAAAPVQQILAPAAAQPRANARDGLAQCRTPQEMAAYAIAHARELAG